MRTTIIINEDLFKEAAALTGVNEKTKLIKLGLEALVARESAIRLSKLGGSEKNLSNIPRRRTRDKVK